MKCDLFWCNVVRSAGLDFCATYSFPGAFFIFRFMMFSELIMRELAGMLIHVRKIFNFMVSFKMLLSICFIIVEKEL